MYDYACRLRKMLDRIYCATIVIILLSIGFIMSGILLISFTDSIVKKAVDKVEKKILIFFEKKPFLFSRNVN